MTAMHEIYSFVNKFMNLCDNGKNANLNLKCQDGKIVINLQLELESHVNQPYQHRPRSRKQVTPSRVRRSARRARARAGKTEPHYPSSTEPVSATSSPNKHTAEKAASGHDASVKAGKVLESQLEIHHELPAEQAVRDAAASVQLHSQQLLPQQAHEQEPQELHSVEAADYSYEVDKNIEIDISKPLESLNMDEFAKILEDVKNNINDGLRQGIREAFKPP